MTSSITTHFDEEIHAFIVVFPASVELKALEHWRKDLLRRLPARSTGTQPALLLDTCRHEFESVACLKLLRELFCDEKRTGYAFSRIAFVQPRQFREPAIVSSREAYFCETSQALAWLTQQAREGAGD